jgi:CubicO group peptidase (beta-lactamase class C family)
MKKIRARSIRIAVAAILCWTATSPLTAQAADTDALSAENIAKIDALFAPFNTQTSPGCALGIMRNGRLAYSRGYGMADIERKVPITPASLFDIASTSKQFTAAAIVLLALDGKLSLSDDVRKYVPELPDFGAPITIDHLLHHTSGLRDYVGLLSLAGVAFDQVSTDAQALAVLSRQRQLNFPSGTRYDYSNSGYFLLSIIAQRVSGGSLAKLTRERIFEPLGMIHALIRDDYSMLVPGRALGYTPAADGTFKLAVVNWQQTGDGTVQLSIEDALKWDENFYQPRVGGAAFVAQMQEQGKLTNGEQISYARGLFVDTYKGVRRVHHGGSWIGYRSSFDRFPDQHTSIAVFCNGDEAIQPRKLSAPIADIVLADALQDAPAAATKAKAKKGARAKALPNERFVGSYFVAADNAVLQVVEAEGALALKISGAALPLVADGGTAFKLSGYPGAIDFTEAQRAPARTMSLQLEGMAPMVATRFELAAPSATDLQAYVGTFYSPELDVSWPIVVHEGRLAVRNESTRLIPQFEPLEAAMIDAFDNPAGLLRFVRDASGRVTGFDLSASRMRDIHFEARP